MIHSYGPENTASTYSGNGMGQHYTDPQSIIVRRAVSLAEQIEAKNVFDLACGRGVTCLALASELRLNSIVAADIHSGAVEELRQEVSARTAVDDHRLSPTIEAYVHDAAAPEGYFPILRQRVDLVAAKDLYPFLNPDQSGRMLGNVAEALRPGGWFLLTACSTRSQMYKESGPGPDEDYPHYRTITPEAQEYVQTDLQQFNFTDIHDLAGQLQHHQMEMVEAGHIGRAGGWIMAIAQKNG